MTLRRYPVSSIALLIAALLSGGCASVGGSKPIEEDPAFQAAVAAPPPTPLNGAIYAVGGTGSGLFEDQRARNVGDVLTIVLNETTAAKTSAATDTAKASDSSVSAPTVFGMPVSVRGTPVLQAQLDSTHKFSGSGDSSQSNTLKGNITVTVIKRLPNGNLLVRGEKHLSLNQGSEFIRIEGLVRPADIAPDNSIDSTRVANARISYTGEGALAESNTKGWLSRFFSSPIWPF